VETEANTGRAQRPTVTESGQSPSGTEGEVWAVGGREASTTLPASEQAAAEEYDPLEAFMAEINQEVTGALWYGCSSVRRV